MSSKFKQQAAGVFKTPPICKSKIAEQNVRPPGGMTLVAIISGDGFGIFGPWSVNQSVKLRRENLTSAWNSGVLESSNGWWYQVTATPAAGENPILFHLAFFPTQSLSPAMFAADQNLGILTPGVYFERRVVEWLFTSGSGRADARVWIS